MHRFVLSQVPESSVSLGKGQKRKAAQMSKAITIGSSPILYTQNTVSAGTVKRLQQVPSTTAGGTGWFNNVG